MSFIGNVFAGRAAEQIGKYNAALYQQQSALAQAKADQQRAVYNQLDRPRLVKKQRSNYSDYFVSLLASGAEFRGTPYDTALEFEVNQALDLSIADYNETIDYIDSHNQSLLLAAKGRGEMYKGMLTKQTEYAKAAGSLLSDANTLGMI